MPTIIRNPSETVESSESESPFSPERRSPWAIRGTFDTVSLPFAVKATVTTRWSFSDLVRATWACCSSRSRMPTTVDGWRYIRRERSVTRIGAYSAITFMAHTCGPVNPPTFSARLEYRWTTLNTRRRLSRMSAISWSLRTGAISFKRKNLLLM